MFDVREHPPRNAFCIFMFPFGRETRQQFAKFTNIEGQVKQIRRAMGPSAC